MKFKDGAKIETDDFWYDLTLGGYIKPEDLLEKPEDALKVNAAIATIRLFEMEATKQGVWEED